MGKRLKARAEGLIMFEAKGPAKFGEEMDQKGANIAEIENLLVGFLA